MPTIDVTVEVDPWDVIDDLNEEQLVDYVREMGYYVSQKPTRNEPLTFSEIQFIMDSLNEKDWQQKRIYEKLLDMRESSCH